MVKPKITAQSDSHEAKSSLAQDWSVLLDNFLAVHPGWTKYFNSDDAAYFLPEIIVKELVTRRGRRQLQSLISSSDAVAESDFRNMCQQCGRYTVGIYQHAPIQYPLLSGWNNEEIQDVAIKQKIEQDHQRQLAYAGALTFHEPYRRELADLRSAWEKLGQENAKRLCFPGPVPPGFTPPKPFSSFLQAYDRFCARWHLSHLASWDLPWPGLPPRVTPSNAIESVNFDYIPPYLNTPNQTVREKEDIAQAMADAFPSLPMPPSMSRIVKRGSRPSEYESTFRMWVFELTVRRRYNEPRGLIAALTRGFATMLHISEDHVRRLRRTYAHLFKS